MKRRRFIQTVASVSAVPSALAQQAAPPSAAPSAAAALTDIRLSTSDTAAQATPQFFSKVQFAALRGLSDLLMPELDGLPGGLAAGAPEFLDFLIGVSPKARQTLYRDGLDALNLQAASRFGKPFGEVESSQADELLAPLLEPWSPEPPTDALTAFLQAVKTDVRRATMNSREHIQASARRRGRGSRRGGSGLYWYTIE